MSADPKSGLRARMRRLRAALARAAPDAPAQAASRLPDELLASAHVVAGYLPIGGEMDPLPALRRFTAAGARLALPAVVAPDAPLVFRTWREGDPLALDALGLPTPPPEAPAVDPDVILIPMLAFDARGGRLGQGGGFFDRTLAALRARGPVLAIGLAYAGQEIDTAPREPHDQAMDATLTETGYIRIRKDP